MKFVTVFYAAVISFCLWASYSLLGWLVTFWSAYFGHPKTLPFIAQFIGSIVLSELIGPAAILTWLFQWLS